MINIETIPVVVLSMTVSTADNETLSRSNRTLNYHDEVIYVDRHAVSTDTYSKGLVNEVVSQNANTTCITLTSLCNHSRHQ